MTKESSRLTSIIGPPVLAVFSIFLLRLLPHDVMMFLAAWTLASFPIGVLIGHCVLSED